MPEQLELGIGEVFTINSAEGTHTAGRGELLHDWFPYLEGFSSGFVRKIVGSFFHNPKLIIEPFNGVGTTPVALADIGVDCIYSEANPFLVELMEAKKQVMKLPRQDLKDLAHEVSSIEFLVSERLSGQEQDKEFGSYYQNTFGKAKYFTDVTFENILRLKSLEREIKVEPVRLLFRVAVASSLLKSSLLKRAGDVRYRTEKELKAGIDDVLDVLRERLHLIARDLGKIEINKNATQELITTDARDWKYEAFEADGVITSPPYLNGTNYIRNTKLELWYLGYLKNKEDLRALRTAVITSAINDVSKDSGRFYCVEAQEIVEKLNEENYDKRIPRMVADYFNHMKTVMEGLVTNVKDQAPVCIDIGDSVYGGVHVPTHEILVEIGKGTGLYLDDEVVLRKRYSNRGATLSQRLLVFRKE